MKKTLEIFLQSIYYFYRLCSATHTISSLQPTSSFHEWHVCDWKYKLRDWFCLSIQLGKKNKPSMLKPWDPVNMFNNDFHFSIYTLLHPHTTYNFSSLAVWLWPGNLQHSGNLTPELIYKKLKASLAEMTLEDNDVPAKIIGQLGTIIFLLILSQYQHCPQLLLTVSHWLMSSTTEKVMLLAQPRDRRTQWPHNHGTECGTHPAITLTVKTSCIACYVKLMHGMHNIHTQRLCNDSQVVIAM